ncbi:MAG: tape measure protein [Lentimicrobium sp.]|jgi:tape measure domain-containing protein|nr:tape measure protein [Lentimicrobium sp.]
MNNLVEFALKMKDLASGQLRQFGQTARTTFQQAEKYTQNLNTHNKTLGLSYNELQKKIKQVEDTIRNSTIPSQIKAARRELEQLQKQANSHVGNVKGGGASMPGAAGGGMSGMMGMAGTAIAGAAVAGIYAAGNLVMDGIQASFERQMVQTSFNVLTGSVEAGEKVTKDLVALQQETILGAEVFKNAQTMMGFGFDDSEVLENLKMLGDVSMGDVQKLDSLTLAFSQVRAGGKLTGQDLLQFINAGFNPLQEISARTGKTMGELKEEMAQGNISFEMVQQAFKDATGEGGKFNNMLEKIAETPAGKMAQLSGAWDEMKIKLGSTFSPLVTMALNLANKMLPMVEPFLNFVGDNVQKIAGVLGEMKFETAGFADYIEIVKDMFEKHLIPYGMKMFEFIGKTAGKFAEFVGKSELLKDVFEVIYGFVGGMYDVFGFLLDAIGIYIDNVIMPMLELIDGAYKLIFGSSPGEGGKPGTTFWDRYHTVKDTQTEKLKKEKDGKDNKDLKDLITDNTGTGTEAEKAITGGGPKVVNIMIEKWFEDLNIITEYLEGSEKEIEQKILEMFSRITAQAAVAV